MLVSLLKSKYTFFFLIISAVYVALYLYINGVLLGISQFNYYSLLLDAIIKGKLNISPFSTIDLTIFQGKWYLNWGPGAIFYISIFKIFGISSYDKFYTLVGGLLNVIIFSLLLQEFRKFFKIDLSYFSRVFIILSFALASPNLYLSMSGRVWFTEQITAVLYILISLFALFKFLNTRKILFFIISAIFFNLSWLTRAPLIFHVAIFVAIFIYLRKEKIIIKIIPIFLLIGLLFSLLFFSYNYLRFYSIFETGLKYHLGNPRYEPFLNKGQIFSFDFVRFNFYYYFLNLPSFTTKSPYLLLNLEGNSIFIFYPLLISLLLFAKKIIQLLRNSVILSSFFVVFMLEMSLLLTYFATGWTQVGMRYFFDLIPLTFLLSSFVLDRIPRPIKLAMLLFGFILNGLGALIFFNKLS